VARAPPPRAAAGIDVRLALPGIEKASVERRRKRSFERGRALRRGSPVI